MSENATLPPVRGLDARLVAALFYTDGALITLFNLLTFIVFAINRQLRRRSFYLVISLTVADLLMGITVVAHAAFIAQQTEFFNYGKLITENEALPLCDILASSGSYMGLVVISLERAFAMVFPLKHRNLSNTAYILVVAIQWSTLGPLLATCYRLLDISNYFIIVGTLDLTGLAIIVASYVLIFVKVKQQNSQLNLGNLSRRQQQEKELAKTLFIMTVVSLLTWLPFAVRASINSPSMVFFVAEQLFRFSNSLVNPVVYVFRMKEFRHALYKLVVKCSRDRPNRVGHSSDTGDTRTTRHLTSQVQRGQSLVNVNS